MGASTSRYLPAPFRGLLSTKARILPNRLKTVCRQRATALYSMAAATPPSFPGEGRYPEAGSHLIQRAALREPCPGSGARIFYIPAGQGRLK
jgi:hypothetical protein